MLRFSRELRARPKKGVFVVFPDISRLMKPREIVLIGASEKEGSLARTTYENIAERSNFDKEKLHLVNPRYDRLFGRKCYKRVSDIKSREIDVAILLIKADYVPETVRECAECGIPFALIMSAGFAEAGGKGVELQEQLVRVIRETGIRVYGPNCPGLTDLNNRLGMTFSGGYAYDHLSGGIGLASQGGGMGRCVMQGQKRGIGFGYFISTGNELDLELSDFIYYMLNDPQIRVIAAVVEGFKTGEKFKEAAKFALEKKKPIVLLKVARTDLGQKIALSHTGSMAGSDEVLDALCKQYGVVRVDDLDELMETSVLFARCGLRERVNLAIVSGSGGSNTLAADLCGQMGLELAEFSEETIGKLKRIAPPYVAISNPVDLTAAIFSDTDLHINSVKAVLEDENIDMVIVPVYAYYGKVTDKICRDLVDAAAHTDKIIVPIWMSPMEADGLKFLEEGRLVPFRSIKSTILAVKRYIDYCRFIHGNHRAGDRAEAGASPAVRAAAEEARRIVRVPGRSTLDEYASKNLLKSIGIPATREQIVQEPDEAVAAAREIGYPVALKIVSPDIPHKTEAGAVRLNVNSDEELAQAFREIKQSASVYNPAARIEGVLVSEMVTDGLEMILGLKLDPQFGSVVLIGMGGIHTELFKDAVMGINPISKAYARSLISRLKSAPLLNGFRGGVKYDVDALADAVEKLSAFGDAMGREIAELDINPLIVLPEGQGVKALDALIIPNTTSRGKGLQP